MVMIVIRFLLLMDVAAGLNDSQSREYFYAAPKDENSPKDEDYSGKNNTVVEKRKEDVEGLMRMMSYWWFR